MNGQFGIQVQDYETSKMYEFTLLVSGGLCFIEGIGAQTIAVVVVPELLQNETKKKGKTVSPQKGI